MMNLLIAFILLRQFNYPWWCYMIACGVWSVDLVISNKIREEMSR